MAQKVLPGDDRLWDVGSDARLYLIHAVAFLVLLVIAYVALKHIARRGGL